VLTTISEGYRELNRELHAREAQFGARAQAAAATYALSRQLSTEDVLDYGCGKGALAAALPFPIREYDPAIPGKDALSEPADLVICCDVMEHVEPECLDAVMQDLQRVVRKVGFFNVACYPARKVLADGRNAHLIQQPPAWWKEKFGEYFLVVRAEDKRSPDGKDSVVLLVEPQVKRGSHTVTRIRAEANGEERRRRIAERAKIVQANIDRNVGYPPINLGHGHDRPEPIAIVGYSPSLKTTWERLRGYKRIWTVSGAHDFLLERGIVPTYHTDVDWQVHKPKFIKWPHPDVQYRMCSGVQPEYLEKLRDYRLTVFAPAEMPDVYTPGNSEYPEIPKGGNAGQQAALLAYLDGWRTQHWFGMDHAYEWVDGEPERKSITESIQHAGWHETVHAPGEIIYVQTAKGRRFFESSLDLVTSCTMMVDFCKTYSLKPVVFGEGLLKDWLALTGQLAEAA
jgi:SAM-dependent methyltransferase